MCNSSSSFGQAMSKNSAAPSNMGLGAKDQVKGGSLARLALTRMIRKKDPTHGPFGAYTSAYDVATKTALGG